MKGFKTLRSQLQFYIRLRRSMSTLGDTKINLSVEQGPYTAKVLSTPNELFDAQALMYQYIREMEWKVDGNHPSGIKILEGFGVKYAVDRFTHNSLIVGTFVDNKTLCGILRIFLKAKQEKLETQQYLCKNSLMQNQNLQKLLLKPNLAEIQRVFVSSNYRKQGLYYMLFDVALQILIDLNLQLVMNSEYPMFQNSCCGKRWENIIDHNKKYNVLYFDEEDLRKLHGHIKKEMKSIYKKARKPDSQCPKKNIYDTQCKPK